MLQFCGKLKKFQVIAIYLFNQNLLDIVIKLIKNIKFREISFLENQFKYDKQGTI